MRRPAFTLIELALVLAIVAIFAAIAAPRLAEASQRRRLQAAGQRLAVDIAMVRERARNVSSNSTMSFAREGYRWRASTGASSTPATEILLSDPPYLAAITAISAGGDHDIVFDGYGAADSKLQLTVAVGGYRIDYDIDGAGVAVLGAPRLATSAELAAEAAK